MKKLTLALIICLYSITVNAQFKSSSYEYNTFLDIKGTSYTVAKVEKTSKFGDNIKSKLLFINTSTGESNQVEFAEGANILSIKQLKSDKLDINLLLIDAKTVDLDFKKGITWSDPSQIIIISPDGRNTKQLTDDIFHVTSWCMNEETGILVVSGYEDTNMNNKKDDTESSKILLYDLQTLTLKRSL